MPPPGDAVWRNEANRGRDAATQVLGGDGAAGVAFLRNKPNWGGENIFCVQKSQNKAYGFHSKRQNTMAREALSPLVARKPSG